MPLKGEAKTEYQKVYMRQTRRAFREAKRQVKALTGQVLRGAALESAGAASVAQTMLRDQLDQEGLEGGLTVRTVKELHRAERPYGKDATPGPDNDARARACELAMRLYERAGRMPAGPAGDGPRSSGARVRMVQIEPDGTERILEIG